MRIVTRFAVMSDGLVDYLSGAIKGEGQWGRICSGTGVPGLPYDNGKGIFQVAVPLEQATYEFFLGWQPPPTCRSISCSRTRGWTCAAARSARQGQLRPGHAWIPGSLPGAHLYVDARVEGRQAVSDHLQDSPLGGSVGRRQEVRSAAPWRHGQAGHTAGRQGEVQASGDASLRQQGSGSPPRICPWRRWQGRARI